MTNFTVPFFAFNNILNLHKWSISKNEFYEYLNIFNTLEMHSRSIPDGVLPFS